MAEKKSINEVIADNLAACMAAHPTLNTQTALAKASGVAQTTITNYLTPSKRKPGAKGKEPSAKVTELAKLARALDVGVWVLVRDMKPAERAYFLRMEEAYKELVSEFGGML